ncbi:MAG: hypothetical protein RBT40_12990 [Petrimonas sp.]|jgi:hypothetical protein|nr:hypothetical protein [Petrimonas sp.]
MTITLPALAKESGHFYYRDGSPAYFVENKSKPGQMRPTTLRDCRKLGLKPSVTLIIGESNKPGLVNWKMNQVLLSALTLTRTDGETDEAFMQRIRQDAAEQAKKAAERGTQIHGWIEQGLSGGYVPDEGVEFVELAWKELKPLKQEWSHEKSFATERYGGKVDLHSTAGIVIDIKTNEKPVADATLWDDHAMQLAAYRFGLDMPNADCGILFVNHKGMESRLVMAEEKHLRRGMMMFNALLDYYYAKTGL